MYWKKYYTPTTSRLIDTIIAEIITRIMKNRKKITAQG